MPSLSVILSVSIGAACQSQHVVCNAFRAMSRAERLLRTICLAAFASQRVYACLPASPSDELINIMRYRLSADGSVREFNAAAAIYRCAVA